MNTRHLWYGIPGLVWQFLFFIIPLSLVVLLAFQGGVEAVKLCTTIPYLLVIARSLVLALSTATLCVLLAYPLAYFIVFKAGRFRQLLLFLVILPFWNNFLLHMYSWLFILDPQGLISTILLRLGLISEPLHIVNTFAGVQLMMIYFYLPFAVLPLYVALDRFDKRLIDSSLDLGATWWQTVRRVLLPLTHAGILTAFFLVCIPSFGEFAIPEFMGGDRTIYVGSVISYLVMDSETSALGSTFTVMSSLVLLLVAGLVYRFSKGKKSYGG